MKRALFTLSVTIIAAMVLLSFPLASAALTVNVFVADPNIAPFETQQITAMANEKGAGILIVVQPAIGDPWEDFLNDHMLLKLALMTLPDDIEQQIQNAVGGKIVSYAFVNIGTEGGGAKQYVFPTAFEGINGDPSTGLLGNYKVLFAYKSFEGHWWCHQIGFDCDSWNVIPEVPLGAATAGLSLIAAAATFALYKKRRVTP